MWFVSSRWRLNVLEIPKVANSGIPIRLPLGLTSIAARIQLRLLQSDIVVETKTKDNVFVMMNVATQYRVNEQSVTGRLL